MDLPFNGEEGSFGIDGTTEIYLPDSYDVEFNG